MKAYLINLDRAPERLLHCVEMSKRAKIDLERVAAVDLRSEFAECRHPVRYSPLLGRELTKGEIACFMSHRKVWSLMAERSESCGLVLEDDVVATEDLSELMSLDFLSSAVHLVKMETALRRIHVSSRSEGRIADRALHRLMSSHPGTAAYVVSREAACRLLEETKDFHEAVDFVLFDPRSPQFSWTKPFQMVPAPFVQAIHLQGADFPWARSYIEAERLASASPKLDMPRTSKRRSRWWRLKQNLKTRLHRTRFEAIQHG